MRIADALALPSLHGAAVVAGASGLERIVRWAHVVDLPDPVPWVGDGQLLLTTGYAWPADGDLEERQIDALAARHLAGIGLAVPGYVQHFSERAKACAERLDLPLLEIPWDVPFAHVTEELHRAILFSQQALIARSEEIHRALTRAATEGITLHELACRLGDLIDRSVTIEDPHGKLLGFRAIESQDDRARRETVAQTASPPSLLGEFERRGLLHELRASASPVRLPPMPELELAARLVCPIRVGGELAGFVWIIEGAAPLAEVDHRAAEHAALVAALQIAHQRELGALESRLGYASFLSLLEAPATTAQTLERAQLLGFDPTVAYRAGIAVLDEPLPLRRESVLRRDAIVERLRRHLVASGVERPMLGASLERIPFLVPDGIALEGIAHALADDRVRLLFGSVAAGTDGVRASYREARELLDYDGLRPLARYEDALVPRVLLGDARAREAFLANLYGALDAHKGGRKLREAMLCYANEGFAFRATANALGIHPNTLRYRLERATALTGLAWDQPDARFRLQLGARLLRLASASDATHKSAPQI